MVVVVFAGIRLGRDVPYTGSRCVHVVGGVLSVVGMGGVVLGILAWQEGAESVLGIILAGAVSLVVLFRWLSRRKRRDEPMLLGFANAFRMQRLPDPAASDRAEVVLG